MKPRARFHKCKQNLFPNAGSLAGFYLVCTSVCLIVVTSNLGVSSAHAFGNT